MKKKLFATALAGAMLLTGCGSSNQAKNDKVVIDIAVEENYMQYFKDVAKDYEKDHKNVDIKVTKAGMFTILDSLENKKGNSADIFMTPCDRIGDLADKKLIEPLNVDLKSYTKTAQESATYKNKKYFVPLSTDTTLLLYNKELTNEVPKTLKEIDPSKWAAKYTDFYVAAGMFYANGGYIFGDNGKDTKDIGLDNAGSIKAGEAIQSLFASKQDTWEALKEEEAGYDQMIDKFTKGQLTYIIDGPWKVADLEKAGMKKEQIGAAVIPSWDGSHQYKPLTSTKGLTVNAYSAEKKEAVKFVESLANKEDAQKWYDMTNEVNPCTQIKYEDGSLSKVVFDATSQGTLMPTDPAFGQVWEPMADALKQIANGEDVKKSLDNAVKTIKQKIKTIKSK